MVEHVGGVSADLEKFLVDARALVQGAVHDPAAGAPQVVQTRVAELARSRRAELRPLPIVCRPTCTASNTSLPVSFVTVVNSTPVASLVSVTVAPGMRPPVTSVTVPTTRDVAP